MNDNYILSKRYFKTCDDLRKLKKRYLYIKRLCNQLLEENSYYIKENDKLRSLIEECYQESREELD